jgi:putative endonuclease
MFFVYILQSTKTGRYYIGSCGNIDARIKDHNSNRVTSTKHKGPYGLVYKDEFEFKKDALIREKQIKSYKSGRAFKKLIVTSSPSSSLV